MDFLPATVINAVGGLDVGHLLFLLIFAAMWFHYKRNGNGKANGNGMAKAAAVEKALANHEQVCVERHERIDAKFALCFAKLDDLTAAVAEVKGYLKGKGEKS